MKSIGIGLLVLFALGALGSGHEIIAASLLIGAIALGLSGLASRLGGGSHGAYVSPLQAAQIQAEALAEQASREGQALVDQANARATHAAQRARDFAAAEAQQGGWI